MYIFNAGHNRGNKGMAVKYMSGRGMVRINQLGQILPKSSKSRQVLYGVSRQPLSTVDKMIASELSKEKNKELALDSVKAVRANIRNVVNKGGAIPNSEAIIKAVVKDIPMKDIKKKAGKAVDHGMSLSEMLSKSAKKTKGKGAFLHGSMQGSGFHMI
jgi:hypothetical protein